MSWSLPIGAQVTARGVRFRVWAPQASEVAVLLSDAEQTRHALTPDADEPGYWTAELAGLGAGTRYALSIDGGPPRPDPASRWQPDGVHAASAVVDPAAFRWHDADWRGLPLDELIVYELHVGTATDEGSFEALIPRLPYFRELGVTALELLPVADFPGCRNWGYDGVDLYAPAACYGGPEGLRRLVDAAHQQGLAIVLDVVYNHFGPDGNYLRDFSPHYFTGRHHTPWGEAINLDGPDSAPVRSFIIGNALYWAHEYHVDGLRLDATHALIDDSPQHLLQQLSATLRATLPTDRHFVLSAEDERNDVRLGRPIAQGGYGIDAIWADDFHHQARIALTGERGGYYADYTGTIDDLATTIADGWFYQGQRSGVSGHLRGSAPHELALQQFIFCIQNHDQIGNRPLGDRLHHLVEPAAYRALSALLLLAPETPLLFQGQEWAASTPFLFFTDHNPELGKLVTEGRRNEFRGFWTETHIEVPDPQAEQTFLASKLRWDERAQPAHAAVLQLYRRLIQLRRTHPALRRRDRESVAVTPIDRHTLSIRRQGAQPDDTLLILLSLGQSASYTLPEPHHERSWTILLDTNAAEYGDAQPSQLARDTAGALSVQLAAPGIVVLHHPPR